MLVFSGSIVLIQNYLIKIKKGGKKKETDLNCEGFLHLPAIFWLRNWSFSKLRKLALDKMV